MSMLLAALSPAFLTLPWLVVVLHDVCMNPRKTSKALDTGLGGLKSGEAGTPGVGCCEMQALPWRMIVPLHCQS